MAAGPGGAGGTGIALTGVRASQWGAAEGGPKRRRANRRRRPAWYKSAEARTAVAYTVWPATLASARSPLCSVTGERTDCKEPHRIARAPLGL